MVLGLSRQAWPISGLLFAVTLLASPALAEQKDTATAKAGATTSISADAGPAVPHVADATPGAVEKSTTDTAAGKVQRTRFLVGLERSTKFTVRALTNPNRVIVDVEDTKLQLPGDLGGKNVGVISSFRAGISGPNQSRIIIDVTEPVYIESSKMEKAPDGKGHRLALSIVTAEGPKKAMKAPFALGAAGLGPVGLQPPMPVPAVRPEVSAAKAFKPIIVIDPGHGGHDSGAMKHGTVEKDVVLAFSKVLREKLEATGRYKVMMTRDADVFVELGDRVKYGEKHNASLFIAVHADYATTKASGATIYSLRESVAKGLKRSAKGDMTDNALSGTELKSVKESAASDFDMGAIKGILSDLAGREVEATQERTTLFSRSVVEYMGSSTNMRNDPDQQAAFRVLKTAQFPSVLIELGYVTNSKDAGNLNSNEWRGKVADSIMTAVDNYFSQQIARLPM
ncbi:MAG: N-acetylmuramoyl-L-alanine amidase [Hyphomicrobiaceae bacterium]|nr:N-acetylmuramoyl-L-alanine amidase [Hyphomicrobiaceae bacterium]